MIAAGIALTVITIVDTIGSNVSTLFYNQVVTKLGGN